MSVAGWHLFFLWKTILAPLAQTQSQSILCQAYLSLCLLLCEVPRLSFTVLQLRECAGMLQKMELGIVHTKPLPVYRRAWCTLGDFSELCPSGYSPCPCVDVE